MRELKIDYSIMSRDTASLGKYLTDINKIPLLTVAEEIALTRMVKAGDERALEKLVETNLRFVVSVAKNYQHRGLSLGDLINEGNIGLIKAAHRFDETKGFKFISFAVWWIRQSILLAISEQVRTIRLPLNMISGISKINKVICTLEQRLERTPSAEEVAVELNFREEKILEYLQKARTSLSLDAKAFTEVGHTLLDVLKDGGPETDHLTLQQPYLEDIVRLLRKIPRREAQVLELYYGISLPEAVPLEEIAALFCLSRERIRQIKDSGLSKLKSRLRKV